MSQLTIRALRATAVEIPMKHVLGTSAAAVRAAPLLLVDLETEEGVNGRSYLFCYMRGAAAAMAAMVAESPTRKTYFSQIERRTSVLNSALTPERSSASCSARARCDVLPSYSPTTMRCMVPVWWITPGRAICVAT